MSLAKTKMILKEADDAKTVALAFITYDYNTVSSVANVADELNKPAILMFHPDYEHEYHTTTIENFSYMAKLEAEKAKVPIAIHLDHCSDFEYIKRAIDLGFTSVMYDGSMLPFNENIENTCKIVEYAHERNVDVEAELGPIYTGDKLDKFKNEDQYTNPQLAKEFCNKTNCDFLAIAVGNAHGYYVEAPHLDIDRIKEINDLSNTYLVLHGGSGIPEEQLKESFKNGINKLNVGLDYLRVYFKTTREYINKFGSDENHIISDLSIPVQENLKLYLRNKMKLTEL